MKPHILFLMFVTVLHVPIFRGHASTVKFSNTNFITVLDTSSPPTPAELYPSSILIPSSNARVQKVTVQLIGVNHTSPDDLDVMLAGPNGERVLLMSDCGGDNDVNGLTLVFSDDATNSLSNGGQLVSGTFQPTDFNASDSFPAPAGGGATATNLSVFNSIKPGGLWRLYVVDDTGTDSGSIAGGWTLTLDLAGQGLGGATTIPNQGSGNPYPNNIVFSNLHGVVTKATVELQNFAHAVPDDVDILLVAPNGTNLVLMSDVGGGSGVTNVDLVFDSASANMLPDNGPLVSGTFDPRNFGAGDLFNAPAPAASAAASLSVFKGTDPNGTWSLYVLDDVSSFNGSIGSWTLNLELAAPAESGDLVISEFRTRGLTPGGTNNEFVEICNNTDEDHTVTSVNGSGGYALVESDGVVRFVITNGTVIPARGHFLGVNSSGYSLTNYPAGHGQGATGDANFTLNMPDNPGLALFRCSNPADFVLSNRLDAVGATTVTNTLYREGAGYPAASPAFNTEHTFYRNLTNGVSKDTDNNSADFVYASADGTFLGGQQRLGAAGPQNLSSPIHLTNGPALVRLALDANTNIMVGPNRVRDFTPAPAQNSAEGTLCFRRRFLNNLGRDITQIRFRVVDLTTFPEVSSPNADLRARTSGNINIVLTGGAITNVFGTLLDQPPHAAERRRTSCVVYSHQYYSRQSTRQWRGG